MENSKNPHSNSPARGFSSWLWIASIFLTGSGARLWLIHKFGTPLPFWDQWEEVRTSFIPYFEGRLSLADLFAPHNENRILFNRLYGLALMLLNGQFDNQVEMAVNALFYPAGIALFGWLLARSMGQRFWPLISLTLITILAVPFAWENTLSGFHSQYYFMILFTLLTIWLLGVHRPGSIPWICGVPVAIATLFTLVGGLLASAAVCALAVFEVLKQPRAWKRVFPTMAVGLVVAALGLVCKIDVPHHRPLMAHSVSQFIGALGQYLAWPWIVVPVFAVFNMFPIVLLAWLCLRDQRPTPSAEKLILGVACWAALQAAAAAYGRGAQAYPQWRYMDYTCFIMIVNALSLMLLLGRYSTQVSLGWYLRLAAAVWVLACVSGLGLLISRAWQVDLPERRFYHHAQLRLARSYVATGDIHVFDGKPKSELICYQGDPDAPRTPHEADMLVRYLDNPWVRKILPACVAEPLAVVPESSIGFPTNGAAPVKPRIPGEVFWSSYGQDVTVTNAQFESLSIQRPRFPFLEFRIAGNLNKPGLSLALLEPASGNKTAVIRSESPEIAWQECRVRAPRGEFRIVASDQNRSEWLAFQAPRGVGWLSWSTAKVVSLGAWIFGLGVILYLVGVGNRIASFRRENPIP